ncbi:MAG TPA: hypothetical protein VK669_14280 [Candidatus Limnocylindrales bacterium]|nr:hypothetical protein [Candidatus Limnocylindrales bacterium]
MTIVVRLSKLEGRAGSLRRLHPARDAGTGIALTFTSPALILAFLAKRPRNVVIALWITTVLVAAPAFLYYLNGWVQFGTRHFLDLMPYVFALMCIGVRDRLPRWGIALIVYSALVGAWGVWYWNSFVRTGT